MSKRTLYFGNPAKLTTKNEQVVIRKETTEESHAPLEDIGLMIFDNTGIIFSNALIAKCLEYNIGLIFTSNKHLPAGLMLNLDANTIQHERFSAQISAKETFKNQLWKQIIYAKLRNQNQMLSLVFSDDKYLFNLCKKIRSGDASNLEAVGARYYWKHLFYPDRFTRNRDGDPPNHLLNYGYTILRAIVARNLTASGLLPVLGIHHRNRYNSFPLADDVMEPFRPFVDKIVMSLVHGGRGAEDLSPKMKVPFLQIPNEKVYLDGRSTSLEHAVSKSTASLTKCFTGDEERLSFPSLCK